MCIYRQNITIFISSMLGIYYNRHSYMFRPLMLAIFRLYHDNISDHALTTDTDEISVPHKITPFPTP